MRAPAQTGFIGNTATGFVQVFLPSSGNAASLQYFIGGYGATGTTYSSTVSSGSLVAINNNQVVSAATTSATSTQVGTYFTTAPIIGSSTTTTSGATGAVFTFAFGTLAGNAGVESIETMILNVSTTNLQIIFPYA